MEIKGLAPTDSEDRDTFLSRCIVNEAATQFHPDISSRFSACMEIWERSKGEDSAIESLESGQNEPNAQADDRRQTVNDSGDSKPSESRLITIRNVRPEENELKETFLQRCVLDEGMNELFGEQNERLFACAMLWERGQKMVSSAYHKSYGNCTGPFGFPMKEEDARELDKLIEASTKDSSIGYRRVIKSDAVELCSPAERSDVSIVTDESLDHDGEIVLAKGLDWSFFDKTRAVSLNHNYRQLPVGKALWWKQVGNSWKAKTQYASRPENYPQDSEWVPDTIWHLVKEGYIRGKSIGFFPVKYHEPTPDERQKNLKYHNAKIVFDEVKVFEYTVTSVPCNENAIVEEISKGLKISDDLLYGEFIPVAAALVKARRNKPSISPTDTVQLPTVKGLTKSQYEAVIRQQLEKGLAKFSKDIPQKVEDIFARALGKP